MKKYFIWQLIFLIFAGMELSGGDRFMDTVKNFKFSDLVKFVPGEKWTFVPGTPGKDWQHKAEKGIDFHMTGLVLLDDISGKTNTRGSEAVIYHKFFSPADGIAQIGVGCDWYFECFVNGILCYSTWEKGNGSIAFSPENHPFLIPVKKGENLLAIRTKRDSGSWQFVCSQLDGMQVRICALQELPWTGHLNGSRISVSFRTVGKIGSGIQYRRRGHKTWQTAWDAECGRIVRRVFHKIFLKGLIPGSVYEYRVIMIDPESPEKRVFSPEYTFRMPRNDETEFSFFFTADHQFGPGALIESFDRLFDAAGGQDCDFFVIAGDMGDQFVSEDIFAGPVKTIRERGKPDAAHLIYPRGNHELRGMEAEDFGRYFGDENDLPFYLFRFGNTAFLVLDSWEDKLAAHPGEDYCKYNLDNDFEALQQKFIDRILQSDQWLSAERHIVLCHGAPFSHDDRFETMSVRLARMTDKYFSGQTPPHKIDFWFTGHKHLYMRSIPFSADLVSDGTPDPQFRTGKNYSFPVITVSGPNRKGRRQMCAFRVDINKDNVTVTVFDDKGVCMEKVVYDDQGNCRILESIPEVKLYKF